MPRQEQVCKPVKTRLHNESEQETLDRPWGGHGRPDLKQDLSDVLDEVDAVLEENAEQFVAQYVQKNGE